MSSTCGKIASNQTLNCNHPIVGGANDQLVLINFDDWLDATITLDGANNQLVTGITLGSGINAYKYEGKNNSNEPQSSLIKNRYSEVYDHEVMFKLFYNDADTKEEIEKMPKGKFVAIIQNNFKGEDGACAFEIYGNESGLEVAELTRILADTDTQGAYNIILRTSEQSKEGHLPLALFNTDFDTTKAIVDGLLP